MRDSTFTTSAPWSASGLVRNGPAPTQLKVGDPDSGQRELCCHSQLLRVRCGVGLGDCSRTDVGGAEAVRRAGQRHAPPLDLDDAEVVTRDELGIAQQVFWSGDRRDADAALLAGREKLRLGPDSANTSKSSRNRVQA